MNVAHALLRTSIVGLLFLGSSCAHLFGRARGEDPELRLMEADRLLEQRHHRDSLERARDVLDELALDMDLDPRLLSRIAMAHYALAYGYQPDEPPTLRVYEAGRETAWRCVYQDPAFEGVLSSLGGRVKPAVAARIQPERADCLLWLVANWSRWLALRGAAGFAIDLEPLGVLASRAMELHEGDAHAQALGLAGLVRSLEPLAAPAALEEAEALFERAIDEDPDNASLRVDLAEYVYLPREDQARFEEQLRWVIDMPHPTASPWALENLRAQSRARSLLHPDVDTPDQPQ